MTPDIERYIKIRYYLDYVIPLNIFIVTVDRIIEDVNKAKAHLDVIDKYMLMTDKKIEELQANDRVLLEEIEALKTEKKKGLLSRFMK